MTEMFEDKGGQDSPENAGEQDSPNTFDANYVAKLRAEAAKYRTEAKDAKTQLAELQPLAQKAQELEDANKSEAEKLIQRAADLQAQLDAAQQTAALATKTQQLTTLAAKVGVSADLLLFLDVSKFDLSDEETTLKTLSNLSAKNVPNGGGPSNPPKQEKAGDSSPADWYAQRMGNNPSIFGG